MRLHHIFFAAGLFSSFIGALSAQQSPPKTGVSGVYEVVVGTDDLAQVKDHFTQFGFRETQRAQLDANQALALYGVESSATVVRMQNGEIDSHGLLRIIEWQQLLSPGVGLAPPETVGVRMAVMRTRDIFRLADIFTDARKISKQPYSVLGPVYDDLYDLSDDNKFNVINRRSGVREMGAYGAWFNHIFFQRYGYTIPGYGTISEQSPLQSSEFTHHDFFIKGDIQKVTAWYTEVLGFKPEGDAVLDGEWQNGPKVIFDMPAGGSHWYRGFMSPNNICGKLKFFTSPDPETAADRSDRQALGHGGITMHTVWTPKLKMVHQLATKHELKTSKIQDNEFRENSFLIYGPDGTTWQIIQREYSNNKPTTQLEFVKTQN